MYVVSSYFMIHYELFETYQWDEQEIEFSMDSSSISGESFQMFLDNNRISGKLTKQNELANGAWTREYARAGVKHALKYDPDQEMLTITTNRAQLPGFVVGLHRIRGYEGPLQYIIYAILLDVVGVSLILFAVTGAILWLKLLKYDWVAWVIFGAGFLYVAVVLGYLLLV
jgi:hypothetical protein